MTEQLDMFPVDYIVVHDNNPSDLFFLELLSYYPVNQVSELYIEKITRGVSVAECILTSNLIFAKRLVKKFELLKYEFDANTKDEKMLEIIKDKSCLDLVCIDTKRNILFRNSSDVEKTKLLCESYIVMKDSVSLTEDFVAQDKIKKVMVKLKRHLINEVVESVCETLRMNIEGGRKIKISYLYIKNSLPKGIITNAKAIELAQEINVRANKHKRATIC